MKKILAIALVAVLMLSLLTACSGGSNDTPSGGGNNNTPSNSSTPSSNSGDNSTPSGNNNSTTTDDKPTDGKLTMSITVADGWKENEGAFYDFAKGNGELHYIPDTDILTDFLGAPTEIRLIVNDMALLSVLIDYTKDMSEREFAEKNMINMQAAFTTDYFDYSPVKELTVGGYKAFEYSYTAKDDRGVAVRITMIYNGGDYAYFIEQHTGKETWETALPDFDAMRDSLTLK